MDCPDDDLLVALFEGRIGATERDAVEDHLDACDACRVLVASVARAEAGVAGEETPAMAAGRTPSSRYELRSVLGSGGMGVVYAAFDPILGREVAIKLIKLIKPDGDTATGASGTDEARILREARALARVTHPNVLSVFDAGVMGGQVFLAMERIHGMTLRAWSKKANAPWERALRVLVAAGKGLAAAHDAGLVHRDFKPDNVLVGAGDRVLVADFGLTRQRTDGAATGVATPQSGASDAVTQAGAIPGTLAYMAPEVLAGAPSDARSDIYAFGVTAHEVLFGERPRADDAPTNAGAVPPLVRAILLRTRSTAPDARPSSMHDVVAELERAMAPARRTPMRRRLFGALAVGIGVAALGLASRSGPPPRAAAPSIASAPPRRSATMIDFAAEVTGAPPAVAAYRAGLESLRGASNLLAIAELDRALVLDPSIGAAHVRLVYFASASPDAEEIRAHYKAALDRRAGLSARDRELLFALEPLARAPPDNAERARRMEALARERPGDAEMQWYLGQALLDQGESARAVDAFDAALEIDPEFALAYWGKGQALRYAAGAAAAIRELDLCVAVSPTAASCLRVRGAILAQLGKCDELLRDATRAVAVEPGGEGAYAMLARALGANGASEIAIEQALQQRWALLSENRRAVTERRDRIRLAILFGDFEKAERLADELEGVLAGVSAERAHAEVTTWRFDVAAETGDVARASKVAAEFLERRAAWSSPIGDDPEDLALSPIAHAWKLAVGSGALKPEEASRARDAWTADWRRRLSPRDQRYLWFVTHALVAETADEAAAALRAMPAFDVPTVDTGTFDSGVLDLARGTVEALVGHTDVAVPLLRRGASACIALEVPALQTRGLLTLGGALEKMGNLGGACDAYGSVVARWGRARPRSRSADAARARRTKLGCKAND